MWMAEYREYCEMNTVMAKAFFKKTTLFASAFVLAVSTLTAAVPFILAEQAGAVGGVVHTTNLSTWNLTETRTAGSNELVANGLHVKTVPSTGSYANEFSKAAGYYATSNLPLADINSAAINFASFSGIRPSLQIGVDRDGNGSWDGYLVYEPWSYGDGQYWTNKAGFGVPEGLGYPSLGSLAQYKAANPNAKVTSIGYSLGSGVVGDATITSLVVGATTYTFGLAPLSTPQFTDPTNGAIKDNGDFTVKWTNIAGATSYTTRSSSSDYQVGGVLQDNGQAFAELSWTSNEVSNLHLPDGTFYWQVRADNAAQSSDWSSIVKVTIDTTAPTKPTNFNPSNGSVQSGTLTFDWLAATDATAVTYDLQYSTSASRNAQGVLDGTVTTVNDINDTQKTVSGLNTGYIFWQVRAKDAVGHYGAWSDIWGYEIDATLPTTPTALSPTGDNQSATAFTWSESTDANGPVKYEVITGVSTHSLDNGKLTNGVTVIASGVTGTSLNHTFTDGTFFWQVQATDSLGNKSAWSNIQAVTIDSEAPSIFWQVQPKSHYGQGAGFAVRPITLTNEVSTLKSVYIDSVTDSKLVWSLNSDHRNFDTSNANNQPLWDSLANGTHKFIAVFRDKAGNSTTSSSDSFIIDRTSPTVNVKPASLGNAAAGVYRNVSFALFDAYQIDKLTLNGVEKNLTNNNFSDLNGVKPGQFGAVEGQNTLVVFDVAGNKTTLVFTLDTTAPDASFAYSNSGNPTKNDVTVTLTSNEAIQTPATWTFVNATTYTKVFTANTNSSVAITDVAGNTTTKNFAVTGIDKSVTSSVDTDEIDTTSANPTITGRVTYVADNSPVAGRDIVVDVDGEQYDTTTDENGDWSVVVTEDLTDGEHIVKVAGVERARFTTKLPVVDEGETTAPVAGTPTTPIPLLVAANAVTPTIVNPAAAVLGNATDNDAANNAGVEGVSTENADTLAAADSEANKGTFLGLGWYWWILIIAALAAIAWWIAAAIRKRQEQEA